MLYSPSDKNQCRNFRRRCYCDDFWTSWQFIEDLCRYLSYGPEKQVFQDKVSGRWRKLEHYGQKSGQEMREKIIGIFLIAWATTSSFQGLLFVVRGDTEWNLGIMRHWGFNLGWLNARQVLLILVLFVPVTKKWVFRVGVMRRNFSKDSKHQTKYHR